MRYILLSIALLFSIELSFGQDQIPLEQDRVIFKNHSQLEGEIIEITKRWVVIKVGNAPFTISKSRIAVIYYQSEVISFLPLDTRRLKKGEKKLEKPDIPGYRLVPIKETAKRGFYNVAYAALQFRNSGEFWNPEFGFGVSNTFGYQLNQFTGLGIGIGYFNISNFSKGGNIVPVYGEYRGYLSDKKVSTYYSLAYGVSFGTRNEESVYSSTKAGSYFYPAIGFKSGSAESSFMVDVGLRFSKVTYLFDSRGFVSQKETIFSRGLILRVGVML